jgi:hypothetical protein
MNSFEDSESFSAWKKLDKSINGLSQYYQHISNLPLRNFELPAAYKAIADLKNSTAWRAMDQLNGYINRLNLPSSLQSLLEAERNISRGWEQHSSTLQSALSDLRLPSAYENALRDFNALNLGNKPLLPKDFTSLLGESSAWRVALDASINRSALSDRVALQQTAIEKISEFNSKALATFPDLAGDTLGNLEMEDSSISEDIDKQMEILAAELEGVNDIAGMLDRLWVLVKDRGSPIRRFCVLYILLPYFISIIANLQTPIYENWWKEFSGSSPRQEAKEVRRLANEQFTHEQLKGLRLVRCSFRSKAEKPDRRHT